ncbi:hypothetical protein CTRI78_v000783 [Colletotrichum trifolii]|uniref:Uncharacterized protein n=1 Tax=Colletotrichum trifolii TaxID=5466 RepID=A0A4R8RRC1_COLTR|nr:hypothetical protein CTRI78_v000783 [Colletotrichum trifolii]
MNPNQPALDPTSPPAATATGLPSASEDAATSSTTTSTTPAALQNLDEATPPTDQEVHEIKAHIAAAAAAAKPPAEAASASAPSTAAAPNVDVLVVDNDLSNPNPEGLLILEDEEEVTNYWDAGAMAPLNAVSAVSSPLLQELCHAP